MARKIPSVGDLRRKSEITDAEIEAATAAFLADEGAPPFVFLSGHRIDVGRYRHAAAGGEGSSG